MTKIKVGKHVVEITHPDKIIFPKSNIDKEEFVNYYVNIAATMLPHIQDRPLTMHRFVDGITKPGFYQKDAPAYFPAYIKTAAVKKENEETIHYVLANNPETLAYLANQLAVTWHIWLSKRPKLTKPDRIIFDLDPSPGVTFAQIRKAAKRIRQLLEDELNLTTFIMTTGSRGVHIVIPIKPEHNFTSTKAFAKKVAQKLVERYPKQMTIEFQKSKRGKRIFVDYLRNEWGQTGVAPYSVRALEGAPVATPFDWDELSSITPQKYHIRNIFKRLSKKGDLWQHIDTVKQNLKKAAKIIDKLP